MKSVLITGRFEGHARAAEKNGSWLRCNGQLAERKRRRSTHKNSCFKWKLYMWKYAQQLHVLCDSPSGEQMNQCIPLAHYVACSARQRVSACSRVEHGLGPRPFLSATGCARPQTNEVADESARWRVSGESGCSGPTNPPSEYLSLLRFPLDTETLCLHQKLRRAV